MENNKYSKTEYTHLEIKLLAAGFNLEQIEKITDIISETCKHCWDGSENCQCWNDD